MYQKTTYKSTGAKIKQKGKIRKTKNQTNGHRKRR